MDRLLSILYPIRNVLEIPFTLLLNVIGLQAADWWYLVYDVVAVAAVAVGVRWLVAKGLDFFKKDSLSDEADIDALIKVHGDLETALQDSSTRKATTALLKKNKRWDRLALAYASLNSHKEAAKYFKKAGDLKMAADQLSKAGLTVKSAQMLMKAGEFDMAGRFFMKADKHGAAAKAFMKAGNSASAGAAYGKAGKYKEAVGLFREYFQAPRDDGAAQAQAAAACYQLLSDEKAQGKISEEDTKALLPPRRNCSGGRASWRGRPKCTFWPGSFRKRGHATRKRAARRMPRVLAAVFTRRTGAGKKRGWPTPGRMNF